MASLIIAFPVAFHDWVFHTLRKLTPLYIIRHASSILSVHFLLLTLLCGRWKAFCLFAEVMKRNLKK